MARKTPFNWKDRQEKSRKQQILYNMHQLTSNPEFAAKHPEWKRDLEKFKGRPPTTLVKHVIDEQAKVIKKSKIPEPEIKQRRFNRVL